MDQLVVKINLLPSWLIEEGIYLLNLQTSSKQGEASRSFKNRTAIKFVLKIMQMA